MTPSAFWPNSSIWRMWLSLVWWHLKPFSSRHCFWQSWQYQRSFCRPLALMRLAICLCLGVVFFVWGAVCVRRRRRRRQAGGSAWRASARRAELAGDRARVEVGTLFKLAQRRAVPALQNPAIPSKQKKAYRLGRQEAALAHAAPSCCLRLYHSSSARPPAAKHDPTAQSAEEKNEQRWQSLSRHAQLEELQVCSC
jgi:hypothetical protein